jgi:hypothetical protein
MSTRRWLATAATVLVAAAGNAQQVRVVVRDSASGAPVSGAVVQLLADRDSTLARSVTGLEGGAAFDLPAGTAGIRAVRVSRIGFVSASRQLDSLSGDVAITLVRLPVGLKAVQVVATGTCPRDPDARIAAALWEAARPALVTILSTREEHPVNTNLLRYTRDGTSTLEWMRQIVNVSSPTRSFATARTQLELYLADAVPAGYALPDQDVLLNGGFVNTHCFHTIHGENAHAHEIGVAFDPPEGADAPVDAGGTLWLEAGHGTPRSIEFHYTSPIVAMRDTAGGAATFEPAPDGGSVVMGWWLAVPPRPQAAPATTTVTYVDGRGRRSTRPVANPTPTNIKESRRLPTDVITEVAEVALASWDTTTTWIGTISRVSGTVLSRETQRPLSGVAVTLMTATDPPYTVVSDSAGRFELRNVFERPYMLRASDTTLAGYRSVYAVPPTSFGGVQRPRSLISLAPPSDATPMQVDRGVSPVITIGIPSVERALREQCGRAISGDSTGIIVGRVTWNEERPAGMEPITVTARWMALGGPVIVETSPDSLGFFRVCGVPKGRPVNLNAAYGRSSSVETRLITADRLLTPVRLVLPAPPADPRSSDRRWK